MIRFLPFLLLLVLSAGCRTESSGSPEASGAEADSFAVDPNASVFEISAPKRVEGAPQRTREVKLVSQTDDATACYLMVESGDEMELLMAEQALCGFSIDLEGQNVKITQEDATVEAISCKDDPDCPEPETVPMVVGIEAMQ